MKNRKYIPKKKYNPAHWAVSIDRLQQDLDNHKKQIDAIHRSHTHLISMLSNFVRHDIKNSIQSMDSILKANEEDGLTKENIVSLGEHIKIIRGTIENFKRLVPYGENCISKIEDLITAVDYLNRTTFSDKNIRFIKEIPKASFCFNLPFLNVIQMLNNLILNAVTAFDKTVTQQEKIIKIEAQKDGDTFYIYIFDNATRIGEDIQEKIFEYGVSTTGGSGIGLFHAKFFCESLGGSIKHINLSTNETFTKYFSVNLPLNKRD